MITNAIMIVPKDLYVKKNNYFVVDGVKFVVNGVVENKVYVSRGWENNREIYNQLIIKPQIIPTIEKIDGGYNLWFDNELIVYFSMGTGNFSKAYLSDKPQEFKDEAMKFFVNGLGKTPSHDLIIPQVTRVLLEVDLEVTRRVEEWFKSVKF